MPSRTRVRPRTSPPSAASRSRRSWVDRLINPGRSITDMANKQITVTLAKSLAGQLKSIQASVRGLGLRRPHQTVHVADTPQNRGMIYAAKHLLTVQE